MNEQADTNNVHIKSGDVVQLNSGGPMMCVMDVGKETGTVWCRWMDGAGNNLGEGMFPADALKIWPELRP